MLGVEAMDDRVCVAVGDVQMPTLPVDGHIGRVIEGRLQLRSRRITDRPKLVSRDVEREDPVPIAIHEDDLVEMGDEYSVRVSDEPVPPAPDESTGCLED